MQDKILKQLGEIEGQVSFYYKNLITGDEIRYNENLSLIAASVIKIPIMIEVFSRLASGEADPDEPFVIHKDDKMPSCGALSYMHDGLTVTLMDLCTLMIIVSDNTATNLLIKRLGMERINHTLRSLGLPVTTLRRLLFDLEGSRRGIQNHICAGEIGTLLEKMYHRQLISPQASQEMLGIMKNQQLNGKIPFCLPEEVEIAHKTGEDTGITHDVGIVYAPQPFVVCFCSGGVDVPAFESTIHRVTKMLYDMQAEGMTLNKSCIHTAGPYCLLYKAI